MSYIDTNPLQHGNNIISIYADRDQIDMQPSYQRQGEIWSKEKRQLLIDSIINRYDIPKLYFHKLDRKTASNTGKKFAVIDGRQRLEAIFAFMDGEFSLSNDFEYLEDETIHAGDMNANELAQNYPRLKGRFDSFNLPIVCVETDELDLIEDMFSRLNEAVPLNAAEKRNAIGGDMASAITAISKNKFFAKKVRFKNTRYQHREAAARLLFLETCSQQDALVDTKKPFLDQFVRDFRKGKSHDTAKLKETVEEVLKHMVRVFEDKDQLLLAQSTIPIYYLLFREAANKGKLKKLARSKFNDFHDSRIKNRDAASKDITKARFEFLEYDRLSQQGTNDASSIRERLRIITRFFGI